MRALVLLGLVAACGGAVPRVAISEMGARYEVFPDLEYRIVGAWRGTLDLYLPEKRTAKTPTLVWFHGGGWARGSKEEELLYALPYLERGWSLVNVEYRLADVARAPAAVEDCRCALGWVFAAGKEHGIGTEIVVVSGISAGGHLALMTAFATGPPPKDCQAPGRISAVVNWFGPTEMTGLTGEAAALADAWLGEAPARALSPVAVVRSGAPPVITLHGVDDDLVPYQQSVALHRVLTGVQVRNRLVAVKGGHGFFSRDEWARAWSEVWSFLGAELTSGT